MTQRDVKPHLRRHLHLGDRLELLQCGGPFALGFELFSFDKQPACCRQLGWSDLIGLRPRTHRRQLQRERCQHHAHHVDHPLRHERLKNFTWSIYAYRLPHLPKNPSARIVASVPLETPRQRPLYLV